MIVPSFRTRLPRFLFFGVTTTTTTLSTTTMCWYSNVAITIMIMIIMMTFCWYSNVAITTTCSKKKRSLPDEKYGERERAPSEPEELLSGKRESEQARQPR